MRIGILPELSGLGGGIYQYSLTMLKALDTWKADGCEDDFVVFSQFLRHPLVASLERSGWTVAAGPSSLKRLAVALVRSIGGELAESMGRAWYYRLGLAEDIPQDLNVVRFRPKLARWFERFGVELMLYPAAPTQWTFETGTPYVMAVHDLQHRLQPEFPEVPADGVWARREYLFRNGTRRATLVLADSDVGREDILNFYGPYGVTPDRVKVLPFLPATYLEPNVPPEDRRRVRVTYHLPERYLFYPAQFWPHKNHARIIEALSILKREQGAAVSVVFCGSNTVRNQTFREVMTLSRQLGVDSLVRHLGYVADGDMSALYAEAAGLVMPTFFGPTNIPVLEAWSLGCPVLTSDIRGIREQTGDAAVLVDPRSVEAIADGIIRLWTDRGLRDDLVRSGRERLARYTPDDYRRRLAQIMEEAKERVLSKRLKMES